MPIAVQRSVSVEIEIQAERPRVFQAWVDPAKLATWWGDDEYYRISRCETNLYVGGKWSAHGSFKVGDKPFVIHGEILTLDQPFNIAFTWKQSWTEGVTTMVELTFLDDRDRTLVRARHVGDPSDEDAEGHREGWEKVLSWMKAYLEGSKTIG